MVPLVSLWLPILLSAVVVFFVSFVVHMVFKYHTGDFQKLPSEDGLMDAIRKANVPPGDYMMPHCGSASAMKDPAFVEKMTKGPVALITVMQCGKKPSMTKNLVQWFIYSLVVSTIAAYITGRALGPGHSYLEVFRFAGCTAFVGYTLALWQDSIWHGRKWSTTIKMTIDGLLYGLFTAGVFGAMWPHV